MSNQACIQQEVIIVKHTGEKRRVVAVYDNYASEHVEMDACNDSGDFIHDNIELLRAVSRIGRESEYSTVCAILEHVCEHQSGITVEGVYHPWEQVKGILKEQEYGS